MEKVDIVVIGAGVVGLAIARAFAARGREVVVMEKHDGFGRETSSRNSEVIHGGMYYPENSLKARMCVEGNRMLYALCREQKIPFRSIGKIVIAQDEGEVAKIQGLYAQGVKNGVGGLRLLSRGQIADLEPAISACEGLLSPGTGIVDTHALMKFFEQDAASNGAIHAYCCTVTGIAVCDPGFIVEACDADGKPAKLGCAVLVNAAGLSSGTVAGMAGIDIDAAGYRIHPCKGEYFSVSNRHRGKVGRLIYPAPSPIHLGTHVVFNLDGGMKLGPNAFYVNELDYTVDAGHRADFFESARKFLPFLEMSDLNPDMAGIRPKLQAEGQPFQDFVINEESGRGLPGLINCVGIESPGLTGCYAIAEKVAALV